MPAAAAEAWPSRPLKIVVPFPPGSAGDAIPRAIASRLEADLGQPCVIENRPGAAGALGADAVARSPADGYTLLSHASAIVIRPHLARTPYDVLADFTPVTQTIAGSYVLLVLPSFPADDLADLLAAVRRQPGGYSYGSYGTGSGPHLAMEMLKARAGVDVLHVPFRGAAPAMRELLAGRIDMAFDTTFAAVPHVQAGRLKPLALGGPGRQDVLPGVATVAESFEGFDTDGWQGIFVPAGTPREVVDRLAAAIAAALHEPDLAGRIRAQGFRTVASTPQAFASHVRRENEKWGTIVRERNIRVEE